MSLPPPLSETAARTLRALLARGSATRPELSEALGVTKQTVSTAVVELEERDLIEAVAVQQGRVGRSALRYALHARAGWVAGVDLGSSEIRVAAARLDGAMLGDRVVHNPAPTVLRQWPEQLELAAHALADLVHQLAETDGGLLGVVIALPRPVAEVRDLVGEGGDDADDLLLSALEPVAPAAIWTENDVNCAALAQIVRPGLPESVLYLHLGVGVGSALIVGRRVLRGARGRAGEIKEIPARGPEGVAVEAALGAEGLLAAAGHSIDAPLLGGIDDLFAAAALGDRAAESAVDAEADGVAGLLQQLCAVVDPDEVMLGGVIGARADLIGTVRPRALALDVVAPVVPDPLGPGATASGAATLAGTLVLDAIAPR